MITQPLLTIADFINASNYVHYDRFEKWKLAIGAETYYLECDCL